ncbi:hypothetical protein [Paenibacillus sp. NPDC057967]|uniref:hypothetical protein n=1 Tax=Paenibacillus sp. NPDC057967 TaxID=3346293 RepID=UPI0036DCE55C
MKIKVLIVVAIGVVAASVYWFSQWDGKPGSLPSEQAMINAIDGMSNEIKVKQLAAVDLLDSKHAFVPFISLYGEHGMSFWEWKKHEWRLTRIDNNGMPHIWKLDVKDPRKRVLVYHIDPKDEMEKLTFYLLRDRNAYSRHEHYFYVPRIQIELPVSLDEQNYGVIPFPEDWVQLMEADRKQFRPAGDAYNSIFSIHQRSLMYVGWLPEYKGGTAPAGRGSYSKSGAVDVEFIPILNAVVLELPHNMP